VTSKVSVLKNKGGINSPSCVRPLASEIRAQLHTPKLQSYIKNLLVELCQIDTTPNADIRKNARRRSSLLQILNVIGKPEFPWGNAGASSDNPGILETS